MSKSTAWKIAGAIACLLALMLLLAHYADSRMVYATPDRESAFLKSYSPDNTIKGFAIPNWGVTGSSGNSAGAGYGEARFKKDFDSRFVIRPEDRHGLSMALTETIVAMISDTGAQLTEQTGNENDGFQFKYTAGKSAGTITLGPVRQGPSKPWFRYLNPGEIPVQVQMTIRETWTK